LYKSSCTANFLPKLLLVISFQLRKDRSLHKCVIFFLKKKLHFAAERHPFFRLGMEWSSVSNVCFEQEDHMLSLRYRLSAHRSSMDDDRWTSRICFHSLEVPTTLVVVLGSHRICMQQWGRTRVTVSFSSGAEVATQTLPRFCSRTHGHGAAGFASSLSCSPLALRGSLSLSHTHTQKAGPEAQPRPAARPKARREGNDVVGRFDLYFCFDLFLIKKKRKGCDDFVTYLVRFFILFVLHHHHEIYEPMSTIHIFHNIICNNNLFLYNVVTFVLNIYRLLLIWLATIHIHMWTSLNTSWCLYIT